MHKPTEARSSENTPCSIWLLTLFIGLKTSHHDNARPHMAILTRHSSYRTCLGWNRTITLTASLCSQTIEDKFGSRVASGPPGLTKRVMCSMRRSCDVKLSPMKFRIPWAYERYPTQWQCNAPILVCLLDDDDVMNLGNGLLWGDCDWPPMGGRLPDCPCHVWIQQTSWPRCMKRHSPLHLFEC